MFTQRICAQQSHAFEEIFSCFSMKFITNIAEFYFAIKIEGKNSFLKWNYANVEEKAEKFFATII
jgi:hypothetical protein